MYLRPEETFATVTQLGAASKAPWSLRIAQPALARHVSDLEQEVFQLFNRVERGTILNQSGRLSPDLVRASDDALAFWAWGLAPKSRLPRHRSAVRAAGGSCNHPHHDGANDRHDGGSPHKIQSGHPPAVRSTAW